MEMNTRIKFGLAATTAWLAVTITGCEAIVGNDPGYDPSGNNGGAGPPGATGEDAAPLDPNAGGSSSSGSSSGTGTGTQDDGGVAEGGARSGGSKRRSGRNGSARR